MLNENHKLIRVNSHLIYPSGSPHNASLWVGILAVNAHHSWQAQKTGEGLTIYLILEERIQRKNISFVGLFKNVAPMFFGRNLVIFK